MRLSFARAALFALALLAGPSAARADEGAVTLIIFKAGWVFGGSAGSGVLSFHGQTYGLSAGGLDGGLVFGGDIDGYNSYAQRGNLPTIEDVCEGGMALMPMIGRLRVLRQWAGNVDMTMDGSPIIDKTPVEGLYFNGGWCYGGFKATPASGFCFAHLLAQDSPHPAARALRLDRFRSGYVIDENGLGAQANLH